MVRPSLPRRSWVPALVLAVVAASLGLPGPAATASSRPANPPPVAGPDRPDDPVAHDPTMVKEGGWYYLAITGDAETGRDYLPMKRSKDLVRWEKLPPVFTELPAGVLEAIGATTADAPRDAWAPDLSWTGKEWRLYYSASRFGTTNSVTALATTKTLDPDDPRFGWVDRGIVLETEPDADYNAIDANYVADASGRGWLTFGSFFSGIKIVQVDAATGKLAKGAKVRDLARRPIQFDPIEGPTVIRKGGWYYLFASFDYCCRGAESDYRVMVGRSRSVTGPYVDRDGVSMLEGGGTEVLRGYNEFQGTGHPDVFSSGGVERLVNHYYDALDDPTPRLNVRTISWKDGWPSVGDPVNPSRSAGHGSAYVRVVPRVGARLAVETVDCGYAGADVALARSDPSGRNRCQQWQIDARDARQVTDGSETGSRFQNRNANMAADLPGCAEAETSGDVRQFDWLGNFFYNVCQRWTFTAAGDGWTTISSIAGRGLVWTAGGRTPGSGLGVATPTGSADQQFRFQPVGRVLLGSSTDQRDVLGADRCSSRRSGNRVGMQVRARGACQTWAVTSTGGAGYRVTHVATGRQLASTACRDRGDSLELVPARSARERCRTWTLVPDDDGSWTLASPGTARTVKLLEP